MELGEADEVVKRLKKMGFKENQDFFVEDIVDVTEFHERQIHYHGVSREDYEAGRCENRKRYGDSNLLHEEIVVVGHRITDINGDEFDPSKMTPRDKCEVCGTPKWGGGRCFDCIGVEVEEEPARLPTVADRLQGRLTQWIVGQSGLPMAGGGGR
jgi:hypothetical protein